MHWQLSVSACVAIPYYRRSCSTGNKGARPGAVHAKPDDDPASPLLVPRGHEVDLNYAKQTATCEPGLFGPAQDCATPFNN